MRSAPSTEKGPGPSALCGGSSAYPGCTSCPCAIRSLRCMGEILTVSTATPTRDVAVRLAESAIAAGLAAGGQIAGPVESVFWHAGEFGQGEEWTVSFKTTASRYDDLEAHLIEHHEWKNPEVTAVQLARASAVYVEWVERVTAK